MNSLNRTPILPQQTTQGSQAPQQPVIISNNDKGNSEIANKTKQSKLCLNFGKMIAIGIRIGKPLY